jgi:hypothetical protein
MARAGRIDAIDRSGGRRIDATDRRGGRSHGGCERCDRYERG